MTGPEVVPDATRSPADLEEYPRWLREIDARLPITAQFLLMGNTRDRYLIPTPGATHTSEESPPAFTLHSLDQALWSVLKHSGFAYIVTYDSVGSWDVITDTDSDPRAARKILDALLAKFPNAKGRSCGLSDVAEVASAIVSGQMQADATKSRVALLLPYASRLVASVGRLDAQENRFFLACAKLAHTTIPHELEGRPVPVFNPILWVLDGERDVPHWFVAGNGRVQYVAIPAPTLGQRGDGGHLVLLQNKTFRTLDLPDRKSIIDRLARRSEGLSLTGVGDAAMLTKELPQGLEGIEEAVRIAKVGVLENPWRDKADQIREGYERLTEQVLGQEFAVGKALDILVRSATGLTGAQAGGTVSRPRGVLFLAGPTGVGKTELAKAITELVFGDKDAYIRFDMSEFRSEHAGERLVGAPPGYVGFDAGGELTNAVRRRPMSVVLFDEIEKAHPRILDKFLQILSDGRLTDGTGATVYFTECVLVFTSNLGMFKDVREGDHTVRIPNDDTKYQPDGQYEDFVGSIQKAVEDYFRDTIERPELLNRLGNNIVVLNYITDAVANDIIDKMIGNVRERVKRDFGVTLKVAQPVRDTIFTETRKRPELGGREIDTVVESALVNPLARYFFHNQLSAGSELVVESVTSEEGIWNLEATANQSSTT